MVVSLVDFQVAISGEKYGLQINARKDENAKPWVEFWVQNFWFGRRFQGVFGHLWQWFMS